MMNSLTKRALAAFMIIAMLLPLSACSDTKKTTQVFAMDTIISLVAYGKHADLGLEAATGVIESMDSYLNPDSVSSYTSQINNANGELVNVNSQVAEMLNTALEVCNKSGGALDLSVYPLYLAWGEFKEDTGRVPEDSEIKELLKTMRFSETVVSSFAGSADHSVKLPAGTQISFGAVAKGCASKYAIDAMRREGVESAVVSLGGNVQTLGLKPDGTKWTIAVEDPSAPGSTSYLGTISVGETAVVTSGNYQRYFIGDDGQRYHHIIDPDTGKPADNGLVSVTIICEDGTLADALSTAMYVLGESAALKYWRTYGGFDMILVTDNNRIICTKGLIESFTQTSSDYNLSFVE